MSRSDEERLDPEMWKVTKEPSEYVIGAVYAFAWLVGLVMAIAVLMPLFKKPVPRTPEAPALSAVILNQHNG